MHTFCFLTRKWDCNFSTFEKNAKENSYVMNLTKSRHNMVRIKKNIKSHNREKSRDKKEDKKFIN